MGMLEKKSVLIVLDRKDYFYLVLFVWVYFAVGPNSKLLSKTVSS